MLKNYIVYIRIILFYVYFCVEDNSRNINSNLFSIPN